MSTRAITLVAAIASNGIIGNGGGLVFKLPGDLPRFKTLTTGKPVIMGRKTWESLPVKPLPGRTNIVLTRDATWQAPGALTATNTQTALAHAGNAPEVMVIGGGEIYALFMPLLATRMELTEVHAPATGDTSFPKFSMLDWQETARSENPAQGGAPAFDYVTYERISA